MRAVFSIILGLLL